MTYPPDFLNRMQGWLGEEFPAFLTALGKRDYGLRLNPLRGAIDALRARLPWPVEPIPWCPAGVWMRQEAPLGRHPYHTAGVYYLQDPSAMAAGVILAPRPGEWVLDLAAAPGGKATHLVARMRNQGVLVANEISRRRASVLAMNLERWGATNTLITNETPERLAERWPQLFDAVLVDAPCSGEGTFSRDPQTLRQWQLKTVQTYAHRQREIMAQAARLVRPGGRLLYGTCTFSPEENEAIIAAFLSEHPDFTLQPLHLPGITAGRPEWCAAPPIVRRTGRFWPHRTAGHGHFYALLQRTSGEMPPRPSPHFPPLPGRVRHLYRHGVGAALTDPPPEEQLLLDKHDNLYRTPLAPSLWKGLHVLRPGWWLASLRHGKVQPDHALAMALRPADARHTCDLTVDDPRLRRFLGGGFWREEGPDGFVLVTVDGFPLGWGKRSKGRLKSRYPVHLRRMA